MGTCPECDADIEVADDDFDEMEIGDPWDCDACGSHLRVSSLDPLEFDLDDEDEDDDEDDESEGDDDSNSNSDSDEFEDDFGDDDDSGDDWDD